MKQIDFNEPPVMALSLQERRIGFALFEGMHEPTEWAVREFGDVGGCFDEARTLLQKHAPAVLVLPAIDARYSRLSKKVREVVDRIADDAEQSQIEVVRFTRKDIRTYFATHNATTKQQIAEAIGVIVPEFARCVPRPRKMWDGEQHNMILFDALALIMRFYKTDRRPLES